MFVHHHILNGAYYPIRMAKTIGRLLKLTSTNRLRVLVYHDIAPNEQVRFAAQLRWLSRSWNFISAQQFADMVSGEDPINGHNLLLTFDDGFASNRLVAEKVLNPMGIHALFFVVSDFVTLEDHDEARQFIARHIQPGILADQLPTHLYNMNWLDLEALLEQGHCVGGHTRTHARLSQLNAKPDLEREIISSADTLAQRLGVPIEHFAYSFGDLTSFSDKALAVARRRFRFIYSGLRGDNVGVSPFVLRRDAVTAKDSMGLLGAYVEGAVDFHYARAHAQLSSWI